MKYDLIPFGKRLVQLIEKRFITQSQLARKLNMSTTLLSLYCTGKKKPAVKRLVEICATLDCSPNWLTRGEGSIDDTFQLSAISNLEKMPQKMIVATPLNGIVEIRFSIPKEEFHTFMKEAAVNGCFT